MDESYAQYEEWKGWGEDQFMVVSEYERAYYDAEFTGIPVDKENVLEIGFGSGSLLAWLRDKNANLYGTEISVQNQNFARKHGVRILHANLSEVDALAGQFGVIAVFDVFEHLTHQEIVQVLDKAAMLLRPGGYLIARFPNGGSPFGRFIQHGDMTHVTTLTKTKLTQLMIGKPFDIQRAGDSAIPMHGSFTTRIAKYGRSILRRVFERGISTLYGFDDMSFYHNMTVVLRRTNDRISAVAG